MSGKLSTSHTTETKLNVTTSTTDMKTSLTTEMTFRKLEKYLANAPAADICSSGPQTGEHFD